MKPNKKLNLYDKDGKHCTSVKQQVEIIIEVFKDTFVKPNQDEVKYYPPSKNIPLFDAGEISKATRKLNNGKSPGIDDLPGEMIKHAPQVIHEEIAEILSISVETEDYLKVLREGILAPLQKPPKKEMERKNNLRPIILLPIVRKILAISVIERIWAKMKENAC